MIDPEWIGGRAAGRLLGLDHRSVPRVARVAGIRRRVIPGVAIRYSRSDLLALAARAVQPLVGAGPMTAARPGDPDRAAAPTV